MSSPSRRTLSRTGTPSPALWLGESASTSTSTTVTWREVSCGFWVARCEGDIVGAIEHAHTYITTNVRGDVVGSFTTLLEAQSALSAPPTTRRHVAPRVLLWHPGRRLAIVAPSAVMVALLATAALVFTR